MSQFRMSAPTWALAAVSVMFVAETLLFFFPGQANENRPESNSPITIKFSCATGSGLLRLDIDRNADPALVKSIDLRSDMKLWVPRGAELHYEESPTHEGTAP